MHGTSFSCGCLRILTNKFIVKKPKYSYILGLKPFIFNYALNLINSHINAFWPGPFCVLLVEGLGGHYNTTHSSFFFLLESRRANMVYEQPLHGREPYHPQMNGEISQLWPVLEFVKTKLLFTFSRTYRIVLHNW